MGEWGGNEVVEMRGWEASAGSLHPGRGGFMEV